MRRHLPAFLAALVAALFFSSSGFGQDCTVFTHNPYTDFNATPNLPTPSSLWLNIHTKLSNTDLVSNGDFLLFTGGTITLNGISSTPAVTNVTIPSGRIVADNTVSSPVTSYDMGSNTWTTRVPPGFSSSDIFIEGAIITSSTGFKITGGKSSVVTGFFVSNRPSFKDSWFYGIGAYQPPFDYSGIDNPGQVTAVGGGIKAGTPIPEESFHVAGGSGGGGSNYTGSYSSTDNFMTCQQPVCNTSLPVTATVVRGDFDNSCDGEATIDVAGGVAPLAYVWSDGVTTSTNTRDNLCGPPVGSGVPVTYTVVVTDANGCQGSTSFIIDVTSIAPSTGGSSLATGARFGQGIGLVNGASLYPNPSNGLVHVQINSQGRGNAQVMLIDMSGRIIKTMVVNLENGVNTKDILLPVHSGFYMLQIRTSKETRVLPVSLY